MLNQTQLDIIKNNIFLEHKQALCIVACAGSGKTTTIVNKVIYMINMLECLPDDFILTTFTKNASEEIKKRLLLHLDANIVDKMTIGTFHSISLKEIVKYNYKIDNYPESIPEEYLIEYINLLNTQTYTVPFKYLFIDEYQDINIYQYIIIKKWYEFTHTKLLLVVGDDQQNIYTFRKTSNKYILNFCKDFNGTYIYLNINYRCEKGIINMSNAIISFNVEKIDKEHMIGKDMVNKDDNGKDMVDKDMVDKDMVDKDDNDKDMVDKDMVDKDMVDKDMVDKDMVDKDDNDNDMVDKDDNDKDMVDKDMVDKDMVDKDIINRNSFKLPKIRFFKTELKEKEYIRKYIATIFNKCINKKLILPTIAILSRTNKILYKLENFLAINNIKTEILQNENPPSSNILLSTIHGSKGLEFDHVIIAGCVDGVFPLNYENIEEERRLFYVGCTRGKKSLLVTTLWTNNHKPSRFIYELYNYNPTIIDIVTTKLCKINYNNINKRQKKIFNIFNDIDINLYIDIKEKNLLPNREYMIFVTYIIHDSIDYSKIIKYDNLIDLEIIFNNMINLHINRMIQEIISDEYVYLSYIKNDDIFKKYKNQLIKTISDYLELNSNYLDIEKITNYIQKNDSEFKWTTNTKILHNILNILLDTNYTITDMTLLMENSKIILINSYNKFQNKNYKSVDILDDIVNLSLIEEIIKGRYSYQLFLNNIEFIPNHSLIEHLISIKEWLKINISSAKYVDYNYDIIINGFITGKIDLIIDNKMIIINKQSNIKSSISINEFIKYLLFLLNYNKINKHNVNIIQYYNPITGKLFEWNLKQLIEENSVQMDNLMSYFLLR